MSRVVAQSFASLRYAREGGWVKTEDDPLDTVPVEGMHETSAAMTYVDEAVMATGGIALRYGNFYGAGNDGSVEPVRKRQFPIVGDGGGVSSFVHLEDAAAATVLALEHDGPAIYNIVDDEPAPVREWLPVLAEALGAKQPRQFPVWLARHVRGRTGCDDGNRGPRRLEREGQAGARLDPALPELAAGLRRGIWARVRLSRCRLATLELGDVVVAELEIRGRDDRVDLVGPAEADDRTVDCGVEQRPGDCDCARCRFVARSDDLQALDEREMIRELRFLEPRAALAPVVLGQTRDPLARHCAGQKAGAHRRIDDDADSLSLREREDLVLDLARHERVRRLERLDGGDLLNPLQLLDVEVRNPDVADQTFVLELDERRPTLFDVLVRIGQ